jgi:hypothetical protein
VIEGDPTLLDDLAASYDDWYRTPLGALAEPVVGQTPTESFCDLLRLGQ